MKPDTVIAILYCVLIPTRITKEVADEVKGSSECPFGES